jgi:phage gp45-like
MHRATPVQSLIRSFVSGGARSVVDKVDDLKMMQEMAGNFMKGETRSGVEAPQNYGFTSVVLPADKDKAGKITGSAEAFISFMGGNRSFPMCGIMDDRRHRPWALKPGENAQYDDIGQMTLMRRAGLFLLSLDSEDKGKKVERMVSLRHVEKKKQDRPKAQSQSGQAGAASQQLTAQQQAAEQQADANGKDHKHEGESVNTEIRCTKNRIEFRAGDKVVGYYDVSEDTWFFTAKVIHNKATQQVKDEAPKIDHN